MGTTIAVENPLQPEVRTLIAELDASRIFGAPIVTEIGPAPTWHLAEAYHREYYRRNPSQPYCAAVIGPKVARLRATWSGSAGHPVDGCRIVRARSTLAEGAAGTRRGRSPTSSRPVPAGSTRRS